MESRYGITVTALLLVFALLSGCVKEEGVPLVPFFGGGQSSPEEIQPEPVRRQFSLPYDKDDVLNPYTLSSKSNREVSALLYDPLVTLGSSGSPQLRLAQKVELEDTLCRITLRGDAVFSDGSPLETQDVLYSLDLARASDRYRASLSGITSFRAEEGLVELRLAEADAYFANLLTFPIVKNASGKEDMPPGIGRYRLSNGQLVLNRSYYGTAPSVEQIRLVDTPNQGAGLYSLRTGDISCLYVEDVLEAGFAVNEQLVSTNKMTFLGINSYRGLPANRDFRQAIQYLLDRQEIIEQIYGGRAKAAFLPVEPGFYMAPAVSAAYSLDLEQAGRILDQLEYAQRNEEGIRYKGTRELSLTLLVNEENTIRMHLAQKLEEDFARAGIRLKIDSVSYAVYRQRLSSGSFDLYLGEIRLYANMDGGALLSPSSGAAYGFNANADLNAAYREWRRGGDGREFARIFWEETPFIPILFSQGTLLLSNDFYDSFEATEQDIYHGI